MKDLSIIITAHSEGIIAHKTILSVLSNIEKLDADVSYEIVIGLDSPSEQTREYFSRYDSDERFKILHAEFTDPSKNRNHAIEKSSGKYIFLIDGDDLISDNFLSQGLELLKKSNNDVIFHPEAHLQFGSELTNLTLWLMSDSFSIDDDRLIMCYWNRWTNVQLSSRDVFLNTPFKPAQGGYGFEDFTFNSDTRAKDIEHKVVPETIIFYRRKENSIQSRHINARAVNNYTDLLDLETIKQLNLPGRPALRSKKKHAQKILQYIAVLAQKNKHIKKIVAPIARNIFYSKKIKRIPSWVIKEWRSINKIENQLYPTKGSVAKLDFHPLSFHQKWIEFGLVFKQLAEQLKKSPDYLFLPPELAIGGTEKLMFNYIKSLNATYPNWYIAVIGKKPPAKYHCIPECVSFIDFDGITKHLTDYEKNILWDRFFIQLNVRRIHIVNSKRWMKWVKQHMDLLTKNDFIVNLSMFMREYVHNGSQIKTLADPDLVDIWPAVNKVFFDNQNAVNEILANNAFDPDRLIVHYQPENIIKPPKQPKAGSKLKILWASRVSYQKRPDLLIDISNELNDSYEIDAYGVIEKNQFPKNYFTGTKINYMGGFDGIDSLDLDRYDIFLYTSDTDGLPNILLEISARGLPIIASDAGGIREFIKDMETGLLSRNDPAEFADKIRFYADSPEKAAALCKNSQKLLKERHSWPAFNKSVARDIK